MKTLDFNEKVPVSYCIPLWLRDEQVRLNIETVKGRISGEQEPRPESIAVVCYGPSLNDTWEEIRDYQYVISCSGAHRFLIDRGIIPTWHIEVDPREHKIDLLGDPHPAVEYLPSSTCHPKYIQHLLGHGANVKLWHVFSLEADVHRLLPAGEWAVTGGSSVGLRALTIAAFFGFRDLHVFGMDGNFRPETGNHAAAHPNQPKDWATVEYGGREWLTTGAVFFSAKETWHELDQMPEVRATFHGDGLVQAMAKDYVRNPKVKKNPFIAAVKPELISAEYAALNRQLHRDNLAYGVGAGRHAETVKKLVAGGKIHSVLDYGCGKGYLAKALPFPIWEYDPAIEGKTESPRPADLVCCLDVLEHVEPDRIKYVLEDLSRCVLQIGYFVIHTGPSKKILADGRNAHILQRNKSWWIQKLKKFFLVAKAAEVGPLLHFVVAPKSKSAPKEKTIHVRREQSQVAV